MTKSSKTNFRFLAISVLAILVFGASTQSYALNHTIYFVGTGASTSMDSVVVLNLTKRIKIAVPANDVLILADGFTSITQPDANDANIRISQNKLRIILVVYFTNY